jgi:FKBP-type peptidyl-prolyl cis-trans isomerase FkpA
MRRFFLLFGLLIIGISSCKKSSTFNATAQAAIDDANIQSYFTSYNITNAVKDPSGLYYQIVSPGTGAHPNVGSNIAVSYTLTEIQDGIPTQPPLESHQSTYFQLSQLIKAWQIAIPLISSGGSMILYVPSALAYGNAGTSTIPPNTVLLYNISLQGFN